MVAEVVSGCFVIGRVIWVAVVGLAAVLLLASLGPAREAMRTQPAPLLRED